MKRLLILIASFALLFVLPKSAYPEKYPFRTYSVDDGLPSPVISTIAQDRKGYLWIGTPAGACKFDGITFTTYTTLDGLTGNNVFRIIEDSKNNLWFGTWGDGVSRFDGENWTSFTTEDGLSHNKVNCIFEDFDGNLWFGTDSGASKYDGIDWTIYTDKDGLPGNSIHAIVEDRKGNLWFGASNGGVSVFDGEKWTKLGDKSELGHIRNTAVLSILEDRHGNIWLGGPREAGVTKIAGELDSGNFTVFKGKDFLGGEGGIIWTMIEDNQGNIWIGSILGAGGLGKYDGEKLNVYKVENGLRSNIIISLLEDTEGNIWIGTWAGGLSRLNGTAFTIYTIEDGLAENLSIPMLEDSKGNVWFRNEIAHMGVCKYDGEKWTTYTTDDGLGGNMIWDMLEDSEGNLWFSAGGNGLSKYDGEKWTTYTAEDWGGNGETSVQNIYMEDRKGNLWFYANKGLVKINMDNSNIFSKVDGLPFYPHSMLEDMNGNLWFRGSEGVAKYNGENWISYPLEDGVMPGVEREILEDKKGNLWFGTKSGLKKFDGESWHSYTTDDGLVYNNVRVVLEDAAGHLWLGTDGGGVSRFDGSTFINYTTQDGLSSNVCWSMIKHESGIYFFTPKGLSRFDGEKFKVYTRNDGFSSNAVRWPIEDSKGNLWFCSPSGVVRFDPSLERPNPVPPPVYITGLKVLEKDTTVTSGLELSHDEHSLRIDYVGICFTSPEDVLYEYKLDGLDEDWHETRDNFMTYNYLPPGEYSFKIKARNKDGIWSESLAELAFTILPPFWATLWFRGVMIVVVLGMIAGIYEAKTRSMKKRNIELGREITARKKVEEALREAYSEVELLKNRLQAENIYLKEEVKIFHNFEEIITNSEPLKRVLLKVEQVAKTDTTALILGETGTGKQLLARAVHKLSTRCDRPLVTVNCSALPASLIESELFGHEKGAFTSAFSRKIGRFELADEGSIFLDEIGDLPLELQPKLLRVLQDGEFERLGSSQTTKVDVRVIAATNRKLKKAVENGRFRADLYYRLNVYPIKCPPLREHKEDIPLLVNHFVRKYGTKTGKKIETIPQQVMETLQDYHWPGNVRELENVIERAVIVSQGNRLELSDWLPKAGVSSVSSSKSHISSMEDNEREHIIKALELTGWRVSGEKGAAKILNINPKTLETRMRKLGVKRNR